jgi:hypothetical protein
MNQKPGKALKIIGWISVIILLVAHFFRINYWPGSGPGIIIGSGIFILFYLPLWFMDALKEPEDRKAKIFQLITLFLFSTTTLFKTMHWPLGGALYMLLIWYCFLLVLPYAFIRLVKQGKSSLNQFHNIVLLFFILTSSSSTMMRSVSTSMINNIAQNYSRAEGTLDKVVSKNKKLYLAFDQLDKREENEFYSRAIALRSTSDSAANYLRHIRNHLFARLDGISEEEADSLSIKDLKNKTQLDIPNRLLIGDLTNLNSVKYSGLELKSVIDWYRDSSINILKSENKEFIRSGIDLGTENVNDGGEVINWVVYTFYNIPSISVLSIFTQLETDIRNAETQILSDLLNSASKSNGNNIAAKIADLGTKIENEAREKKISLLQKEGELNQLTLDAKNRQIADSEQTTFISLMGVLACIVAIFFIIRSNILRKEANKKLAEQKHEIEEKNKEITDSIRYAKRIQQAHLPTDKYLSSKIKTKD